MKPVQCSIALIVTFCLLLPCTAAEEWHPGITPINEIEFNWPPPREIGAADFFTIARNGRARCDIVIPAEPTPQEEKSAGMLATYLKIVTGGDFEVKREPYSGGPAIYIGETTVGNKVEMDFPPVMYPSLTLPNLHAFVIKTVDRDTLVIRGATRYPVVYAVSSFLRRVVGVERYWPTEPGGIGDVYTPKPTLTVPEMTWKDWPYLISRHVGFPLKGWDITHENEYPDMFLWYRGTVTLGMMHNFFELISPAEYGETHPEYFPEINGRRMVPTTKIHWQPCVSNREVVEICARKIIAAFDADPKRIGHALAVNDGSGHCECANCKAMDSPEADANTTQLTDRYIKFMNAVADRVAAKHPDRLIGFLSYGAVRMPPTTVKLHPNLVPYYCAMGRGIYDGWDRWMAAGAKNMGHYGYHNDRWFTIPKINPHQEAERIRYMVGSGVQRGYYKEFNPTYPLDAHAAIVCAELQWDPRLDEDRIIDKYYDDMFAEASAEMRGFYETLENDYEAWLKETAPPHPYGADRSDLDLDHDYEQFQVLTAKGADKAWDWLLKAESRAMDPKVKQRIRIVKSIFDFVRQCTHEYWLTKSLPNARNASEAEKLARDVLRYAREKAEYKANVMESPEIKPWHMTTREPYDMIKPGVIPIEVCMAIDDGFRAAYRAKPKDPAWQRLAKDPDPVIAQSAQAVIALAGSDLPNVAPDPGFEEQTEPELRHEEPKQGSAAIVKEQPHSGEYCAMLHDCKATALVKSVPAKPGEKYVISVWMRSQEYPGPFDVPGLYGIRVNAVHGGRIANWVRVKADVTGEWQQFSLTYTTPADTDRLDVLIQCNRQHAKARLWIDDISIVRAPVEPLKFRATAAPAAPGDSAYEE